MSKDPAFLFYSDNFLSGIMFLSDEQTGKYMRLLCAQHLTGHLKEKDMIKICQIKEEDIWKKFEKDEHGLFFNRRLEEEINKRKNYTESRANNRRGKKKESNLKKNKIAEYSTNERKYKEENVKFPFELFWNLYNKKTGKVKCEIKWNTITDSEKELVMQRLPAYIAATESDVKFRKDPYTWLNGQHWLDEHVPDNTKKKSAIELLAETGRYE